MSLAELAAAVAKLRAKLAELLAISGNWRVALIDLRPSIHSLGADLCQAQVGPFVASRPRAGQQCSTSCVIPGPPPVNLRCQAAIFVEKRDCPARQGAAFLVYRANVNVG